MADDDEGVVLVPTEPSKLKSVADVGLATLRCETMISPGTCVDGSSFEFGCGDTP